MQTFKSYILRLLDLLKTLPVHLKKLEPYLERLKVQIGKFKMKAYKILQEDRRQGDLRDGVELTVSIAILLNVVLIVLESMGLNGRFGTFLSFLRNAFFVFFLTEYFLRLWISDVTTKEEKHPIKMRIRYMLTFRAIIDLLALLPVMFGGAVIDFRIFRVLRLLRITQLKNLRRYTDTLVKVLKLKGSELIASLFIAFIFMLASAVIIYDFENKVQPDVYDNILSCLWWSMSAVTTVGYGDMYPITPMGKILGSFMSIFGVFLMAVPVGILTSGFFEVSKHPKSKR